MLKSALMLVVALLFSVSAAHAETSPEKRFLPIDLKCPAENNGILEFTSQNQQGTDRRIQVEYKGGVATRTTFAVKVDR